jgi:regulator of protease activity HflC (stomatin/prohibitin superfamily)
MTFDPRDPYAAHEAARAKMEKERMDRHEESKRREKKAKRARAWLIGASVAGSAAFLSWALCFKMISPGYVGVVVDLLGDNKGVEAKELHVGMHWISPWKSVYQFPIFEQNDTWEGERETFNFQTSEGMAVSADVGITYHLRPECIPLIFQKYRRGMDEITHVFIRNYIRDAINKSASHIKIEDLYSSAKESFFSDVEGSVRRELAPIGIDITRIYLIGRFHFPQTVITSLNSKIEATQRAEQRENELREAEAEAKKKIAQAEGQAKCSMLQAEAEAKANAILSQSVTAELIQWQAVQKWDGKLPTVTSGATPFIQVK